MIEASFELEKVLAKLLADWENLKDTDIKAINAQLPRPNQPQLIFR